MFFVLPVAGQDRRFCKADRSRVPIFGCAEDGFGGDPAVAILEDFFILTVAVGYSPAAGKKMNRQFGISSIQIR